MPKPSRTCLIISASCSFGRNAERCCVISDREQHNGADQDSLNFLQHWDQVYNYENKSTPGDDDGVVAAPPSYNEVVANCSLLFLDDDLLDDDEPHVSF